MRAAIYARYSSELQSSASTKDQVRLCERLCAERGWTVAHIFADDAMSGTSHLRPGFQQLQQVAANAQIDVIVAESLDRLSRDQEHIAALHKRMNFLSVRIVTKAEGEINELHVGLGGTMSALFLKQLAQKTHRGLEGRIRAGLSAGGISYGYKAERKLQPDGSIGRGERIIDPYEANVVERIFREYALGSSARTIAALLNRECIKPPRSSEASCPKTWSFSTISGNWRRGTGILNNELYIGRLVWNRQRFVKDPMSGKRQARENPESSWIIEAVPHLRIIDDELWDRVKLRQRSTRDEILSLREAGSSAPRTETARRRKFLLSGLLHCGCCGAKYVMVSETRYGCSGNRNRGTCDNRRTIKRLDVEERVLSGLRDRLMAPELITEFIREYHRELANGRREAKSALASLKGRLGKIDKAIGNILKAIKEGMYHLSLKAELEALEGERAAILKDIAVVPEPEPVELHPGIANVYRKKVETLADSLNRDETRPEASEILRSLVEKVILTPSAAGFSIELYGELAGILALCSESDKSSGNPIRQLTMVAGAGFEPTTFRL